MNKLSIIIVALLVCGTLFAQQPSKATLSCDAPESFRGEYRCTDDSFGTMLSWHHPNRDFWYHYDEEPMSGSADITRWGVRIPFDNVADNSYILSKVMFYRTGCTEHGGNITVNVYYGGETSPGILVFTTYRHFDQGSDEWVEIDLWSLQIELEPIWIVFETSDISNAAAYCPTSGNPDGRWAFLPTYGGYISYDYYAENGIGGDWMIRTFFVDNSREDNEVDHFNLYRGESLDNMSQIAEVGKYDFSYYDDLTETLGEYYYRLTASYDDECESVYALDMDNPENDYVHINVTSVNSHEEENLAVFPNPAKDRIVINGIEAYSVQVYNALGQKVKIVENANEISVADLPEGVYLLKVTASDGTNRICRVVVGR